MVNRKGAVSATCTAYAEMLTRKTAERVAAVSAEIQKAKKGTISADRGQFQYKELFSVHSILTETIHFAERKPFMQKMAFLLIVCYSFIHSRISVTYFLILAENTLA